MENYIEHSRKDRSRYLFGSYRRQELGIWVMAAIGLAAGYKAYDYMKNEALERFGLEPRAAYTEALEESKLDQRIIIPIKEADEIGAGLPIQSLISDKAPGVRMLRRNPEFVRKLRNAFSACGDGRMEITIKRNYEDNERTAVIDCRKP